jgi:hypothetical protein
MTELERLVALEDIRALKARRVFTLDTKDWETYASLHAEDHVSDTLGAGPTRSGKALAQALAAMLDGVTTNHHVHTPIITFESPELASGVWAMEDWLYWKEDGQPHWLHGCGHYHERYAKRDGVWRFIYRRLDRTHVEVSPGSRFASHMAVDRTGEPRGKLG